jgi:hypothetical protein
LLYFLIQSTNYIAVYTSSGTNSWFPITETNPKYFKPKKNLMAEYYDP